MKRLTIISFFITAVALAASAQLRPDARQSAPVAPDAAFAPLAAPLADAHGIITEQPDGDYYIYTRDGGATYASVFFRKETQTGIISEVVFSEDGQKAYIKNVISHATTNTWVEGTVEGSTITVPLGQMVYWFDKDANGKTYGMRLARVKVSGSINEYTCDTKGSVTFTIDGDRLILNDTSGDPENTVFDGLGLVYTDEFEGEWSYYLDYETVMTRMDEMPIFPPNDLYTETYSLEHEGLGHIVRVGFSGNDVYVQGASENNLTAAWMKGTLDGTKITFPAQPAGQGGSFMLYFCGADGTYELDAEGYYTWNYNFTDGSITFDYDPETRSFRSDQTLFLSNSKTAFERGESFHSPLFRPYTEHAGTPSDPKVLYFVTDYFELAGFNIAMFDVPLYDTEGRFMDPTKLSYQLFVDDDEPYTLYTDEYKYIEHDMDEIPYLYADRHGTIYEKAYGIYIYQSGFDRFGIQSIYRGGGEEHRSNISYYVFGEDDGIETLTTNPAKAGESVLYDLSGRRVDNAYKGIVVKRRADGSVVKQIVK